jgi:hypothetical protein
MVLYVIFGVPLFVIVQQLVFFAPLIYTIFLLTSDTKYYYILSSNYETTISISS